MDLEKIKQVIDMVESSSMREFYYSEGDMKIAMSKNRRKEAAPAQAAAPAGAPAYAPAPAPAAAPEDDGTAFITAPIVGTFYSASAPDAPAYVKVGDRVHSGETVCILEAMKLMTEIEAEYDCEIESILVSNEQKVEYGQPLFKVKRL